MESDEDQIDKFFEDIAESLKTDSWSRLDQIPNDKILKALNDLNNFFSLHPADADHPEKRSSVHEAVQVLSRLNKSYGLSDSQIERVGHLVENWSPIIDQAVAANRAKQDALERLSPYHRIASSLRDLTLSDKDLKEEYNKLECDSDELQRQIQELRDRSEAVKRRKDEVKKERGRIHAEATPLKDQYEQLKLDAPKLKGKLDEATESLDRAQREWVALKNTLDEVSAFMST
ncbi:hypothetical protein CDL15_Pgr012757 [Punica granatum]|uniref:Uncharacterized protein n=1 Tax=Punica granatum TaxID=22663 RepID=A0A218XEW9_PUNGR|nr:hypothetical protein CDL15_Pgr012757 [Punica granatum]